MSGATTVAQQSGLAAESIGDRRQDDFNLSRSAEVLMHDEPDRANRGRLIGPDANDLRRGIARKHASSAMLTSLAAAAGRADYRSALPRALLERQAHEKPHRGDGAPVTITRS